MNGRDNLARTFEALLERARSGDLAALKELFESARPLIGDWATQQLSGAQVGMSRPSDIAQDTSLQAYTRFPSFKGTTEAEWQAWLRATLHNIIAQSARAARQQKRDERRTVSLDDSEVARTRSGQPSPSEVTSNVEHWRDLMTHIFALPPDQQDAIKLVHLQWLTPAEAAEQLGKTEAAVNGLIHRGIQTLRERMAGEKPHGPVSSAVRQEAATALLDYRKRCQHEGQVDVEAFLAEHPNCADELRQMIDLTVSIRALRPASGNE
jgi:RNA polymerase sigma-70 factor, ECF subfamily